jgi:hypothetical protein
VGAGGPAGGKDINGEAGGSSSIALGGSTLALVEGGGGGVAATSTAGGAGGAGAVNLPSSGVSLAGLNGSNGNCTAFGGDSFTGSIDWDAHGGDGGVYPGVASAGSNGEALLTW